MYYDLNVPYTANHAGLQRTLAFLSELGYDVVALNVTLRGKLPADVTCPLAWPPPFAVPARMRLLRRCTLELADATQNHRLAALTAAYDVVALRPTDEKTLAAACTGLDCDLVSLDMTLRYPFFFKMKTLAAAVARGVRLELCYAQASHAQAAAGAGSDAAARRQLITNATGLTRATRGRGIVISSEAAGALACRAPADVVNLAVIWGLSQERGVEAVGREARSTVIYAEMRRKTFKGVVDVVFGGEPPVKKDKTEIEKDKKGKAAGSGAKRKAGVFDDKASSGGGEIILSKREQKRRAKASMMEAQAKEEPQTKLEG